MTALKWTGIIYLILSAVLLLGTFGVLLFEDIRMYREPWRKTASKVGFNLRWNGLGWPMLLACLPILNLIVLYLFILPNWIAAVVEWFRSRSAPEGASTK
jgi:hypothetical protein